MKGFVIEFFRKTEGNNDSTMCLLPYGYWTGEKYRFEKDEDEFFPFCTPGIEFGRFHVEGKSKTKIYRSKKHAVEEATTLMEHINSAICCCKVQKVSCRTVYVSKLTRAMGNV